MRFRSSQRTYCVFRLNNCVLGSLHTNRTISERSPCASARCIRHFEGWISVARSVAVHLAVGRCAIEDRTSVISTRSRATRSLVGISMRTCALSRAGFGTITKELPFPTCSSRPTEFRSGLYHLRRCYCPIALGSNLILKSEVW